MRGLVMPKPNIPQTPIVEANTDRPTQAWHRFFAEITNFPQIAFNPDLKAQANPDGFMVVNLNNSDVFVPFWRKPYGNKT